MKATKTQRQVVEDVFTLELSRAEALALYTLVGQSSYALCQGLAEGESILPEGGANGMTIDWIIHNAIADLLEPTEEES